MEPRFYNIQYIQIIFRITLKCNNSFPLHCQLIP